MAKLFFRYAAMNAGKSTALLQVAYNYEERGHRVRLFTAQVDDRYGRGQITSRLGPQREAELFQPDTDFLALFQTGGKVACILIDEAQFLQKNQVWALHELAHLHNVPVICYGLRTDFQGELFSGSASLLALADEMDEMKTICDCGRKATMNMRVDANNRKVTEGQQVEIGGNARYRSVCGRCFRQS
ncbi:thymidine kinase [Paucibacter oligotrophus]|uniref:Thymidine kinase n=1 Tax=Roseateles oligotrophus TaxID=1769250 RepID=A0A840LFX9_9BURK|nr:thymidine kinase [Roseateles oligotrophus]MBB4845533.1 thymidine kinase [Roseateles oligotrophus]